jgi:hypothetical protein
MIPFVSKLADHDDAAVRRECLIALRHNKSPEAASLWLKLAQKYDGKDRWYLEALGIGADRNWDALLDIYVAEAGDKLTPAMRDIIWRSRGKQTPQLLASIIKNPATPKEEHPRYLRAFDFLPKGPEKDKALAELLTLE